MKPLHAGVEVDQSDGYAGDGDDWQLQAIALILDQSPFLHVDIERIDENINRVEAQFFGLTQTIDRRLIGLHPGGVDEAETHGRSQGSGARMRVQGSKFKVQSS